MMYGLLNYGIVSLVVQCLDYRRCQFDDRHVTQIFVLLLHEKHEYSQAFPPLTACQYNEVACIILNGEKLKYLVLYTIELSLYLLTVFFFQY